VKEALKAGRSYVAFGIFGEPSGFDFYAEDSDGIVEMGGQAKPSATLIARAPRVFNMDPAVENPVITMKLLRISNGATTIAAEGDQIRLDEAEPGVYRIEVRIVPNHLRPYLGETPDDYIRESAWVFSNAIRVL
jgi:hypothetical protein